MLLVTIFKMFTVFAILHIRKKVMQIYDINYGYSKHWLSTRLRT
jgi:hypothetical protein